MISILSEPSVFANLTSKIHGNGLPDGLAIDKNDNIFASAPGGLVIFSKTGEIIGIDKFDEIAVSNIFLGPDGFIYITGSGGVYRQKLA